MALTLEDIKRLISLQLGKREINDHDRFLEDLAAESIDVMNIIIAVEEKYQVEIKESEVPEIRTPLELYTLVKSRV